MNLKYFWFYYLALIYKWRYLLKFLEISKVMSTKLTLEKYFVIGDLRGY